MESATEQTTEGTLRLVDSLGRFQEALFIEDPRIRDRETLRNVAPLIEEIEASYEYLSGISREHAHKLVEVLSPLSEYSKFYESTTSILRCIDRSIEVLQKVTHKDDAIFALEKTYSEFRDSIISSSNKNLDRSHSYLKTTNLDFLASSLLNEVTGDLLERYYVPKLVENMGYQLKSRTVPTSVGDVEVDIRAEKDKIIGLENLEKHKKKDVIIVETKATVNSEDIRSLSKKSKAILENYHKELEIWKYDFASETWIVACYGWNDELKNLARSLNIRPIDGEELENMLQKYNLLHRGRPPCRKRPKR